MSSHPTRSLAHLVTPVSYNFISFASVERTHIL